MRSEVIELKGNARLPILSVGIIAIRWIGGKPHFLLINRKDTMAFCDIVRRRHPITDPAHLQRLVNCLTNSEKQRLLTQTHAELWRNMWGEGRSGTRSEEKTAAQCLTQLRESGLLTEALAASPTSWEQTEWEFPKGRKAYQERDQACALREFGEETGISPEKLQVISNIVPIEETYTGTNGKAYRHRYYLGTIEDSRVDLANYQRSEVHAVQWMSYTEAMAAIRPYHAEKRRALTIASALVSQLRIMSAQDRDGRPRQGRPETWGRAHWGVRPPGTPA
jgi:8-oxo-dGTP pyrophosphatase MutT (NUDIX family)